MVTEVKLTRRSSERLRYAVDVAHKTVNDAFKIFSRGSRPYHQLFSDVCQDITAQLDTLNLLIKPLLDLAPLYDFEDVEANGLRSLLGVVDSALRELIAHLKYCIDKNGSIFFNGTNCAAKLARLCNYLAKLGKLLDIATLMDQHSESGMHHFLDLDTPVGTHCVQEMEAISRECFYGQLVGLHFTPAIRNVMKGVCVALSSYGIGYYTAVPPVLGQAPSLLWRSSASIYSGAKYWFYEEERSQKFVELTNSCASIEFTKSFWGLVDNGILAEVPKIVNRKLEVAAEIYVAGNPLYVRNATGQMILIHPPTGSSGPVGVILGFLSSKFREGQMAPTFRDPEKPLPERRPKSRKLLVHFHGGGFVSGSHLQHEAYLGGWCEELDAVVVSIDYSLAPEHPFPKGLDDCIFAYAWCLENLHTLGCTGDKILFMGDSAGGNLALTTAMRAASYGLRPPDGIVACYPVTYVKYAGSMSRLLSTMDILLPTGVMQCCMRAYSGVPVETQESFLEWLDHARVTPSTPTPSPTTISEQNSRYIEEVSRGAAGAGGGAAAKYTLPDTPDMPDINSDVTTPHGDLTSESVSELTSEPLNGLENGGEVPREESREDRPVQQIGGEKEEEEDDRIQLNPIVFDSPVPLPAKEGEALKTEENASAPVEVEESLEASELAKESEDAPGLVEPEEIAIAVGPITPAATEEAQGSPEEPSKPTDAPVTEETEGEGGEVTVPDEVVLPEEALAEVVEPEEEAAAEPGEAVKIDQEEAAVEIDQEEAAVEAEVDQGSDHGDKEGSLVGLQEELPYDGEGAEENTDKPEEHADELREHSEEVEEHSEEVEEQLEQPSNGVETTAVPQPIEEPATVASPTEEETTENEEKDPLESAIPHGSGVTEDAGPVKVNLHQPSEEELEQMLYDDQETQFVRSRLVLNPTEPTTPTSNLKQAQPASTPSSSPTRSEPYPYGKQATVIREAEEFPEPVYVINPGEIRTQRNVTLLQKYFEDPFMSPLLAGDELLSQLPPVYIIGAEYDPLLDDSIALCRRIKSAGGRVRLDVVPGMTHGFLNLVLSNNAFASSARQVLVAVNEMFGDE